MGTSIQMTAEDLIAFERCVADAMMRGEVLGPAHLSGGNEAQLVEVFREVRRDDWVFSTYRSHYHALLHGLPPEWVYAEILAGRSMSLQSLERRFYTSAIVGGCLPIALGVAAGIKPRGSGERVWCFVGDMAASGGTFRDCETYALRNDLPITFVVEDNGYSTNTPTDEAWGNSDQWATQHVRRYRYERTAEHIGAKAGVSFS